MTNKRYQRKDGGEFKPLQPVETMNAALSAAEKLMFLYVDLELPPENEEQRQ